MELSCVSFNTDAQTDRAAHLTPRDRLIIISGTNDITRNKNGSVQIYYYDEDQMNIISQAEHTGSIMVSAPYSVVLWRINYVNKWRA